jgi:hypothetical protein
MDKRSIRRTNHDIGIFTKHIPMATSDTIIERKEEELYEYLSFIIQL